MNYKLYYDASCPVCSFFVQLLKKKTGLHAIGFFPLAANEKRLKLATPTGKIVFGQDAIRELTSVFPAILDYFWMLPKQLRKPAVTVAYQAGSIIRIISKIIGCKCRHK